MSSHETKTETPSPSTDLFSFSIAKDWSLNFHLSFWPILVVALLFVGYWLFRWHQTTRQLQDFQIDSAKLGLGKHSITFKPNETDRQIAYSVWVELSTRKIGLPIDLENDVISEVYNSWYSFFGITRELVKSIPVSKVRQDSTGKIIQLSIEVLNEGLRPHLTKWQARYRRWYESELEKEVGKSPQEIQKRFPDYQPLCNDLLRVNAALIEYRRKMYELVSS